MNIRNWFVDKDNNDRTWYKIVNLLSTVIALWLGYVAYNLAKDVTYQTQHLEKLDAQQKSILELIKTNAAEVDALKQVVYLLRGDSNTQNRQLASMITSHRTSIMPKLIFSNGGYGGQDYTFNFENKGSALFDLKFSSVDKLRFGYYIPNMDQYASQFLQIENCTKPQHTIKVEYRDIERHKYSQLITIFLKDGQDLKFTEAVEVQ